VKIETNPTMSNNITGQQLYYSGQYFFLIGDAGSICKLDLSTEQPNWIEKFQLASGTASYYYSSPFGYYIALTKDGLFYSKDFVQPETMTRLTLPSNVTKWAFNGHDIWLGISYTEEIDWNCDRDHVPRKFTTSLFRNDGATLFQKITCYYPNLNFSIFTEIGYGEYNFYAIYGNQLVFLGPSGNNFDIIPQISNPNTLLSTSNGNLFVFTDNAVFKVSGSKRFSKVFGLDQKKVNNIIWDEELKQYYCTSYGNLFYSTDGIGFIDMGSFTPKLSMSWCMVYGKNTWVAVSKYFDILVNPLN